MPKGKIFGSEGSMLEGPMGEKCVHITKASNGFVLDYGYGSYKSVAKTFSEATKNIKKYFNEIEEEKEE